MESVLGVSCHIYGIQVDQDTQMDILGKSRPQERTQMGSIRPGEHSVPFGNTVVRWSPGQKWNSKLTKGVYALGVQLYDRRRRSQENQTKARKRREIPSFFSFLPTPSTPLLNILLAIKENCL